MFKATRLAVPMLLAVMALNTAAPALAAPAAPVTEHEVREDVVYWLLTPGQCPNLPEDQLIVGTGTRVTTLDSTFYADDQFMLARDQTTTGIALDLDGTEYTFYSNNHLTAYAPGNGADVQFRMYDLFLLQSPAAAAQNDYVLRNSFDWSWTFDIDANPFDVWPPANLEKTTNYGNAVGDRLEFVCDPM